MAVTRINNNQITDAVSGNVYVGINANTKLQNYSITSQKLANSLTYGSDLTITGNLTIQGTTTSVDTVNTLIQDPLITLSDGQVSGTPTLDIGTIGLRGSQLSAVLGWKESQLEFVTALSSTTISNTTFTISSYANLHTGNLTVQGTTSLIGNVLGATNFTSNITGGNILTGGNVSATGNVIASWLIGNIQGNVTASGANTQVLFNDGGVTNATSGFTFDKTSNLVTVGGNVNAANFNGNVYGTSVSASGTVTAASTVGGVITGSSSSVTGTQTAASTVGGVITGSSVSVTGDVSGSNLSISGGNINSSASAITVNGTSGDVNFAVNGDTTTIFFADAGTETASFGSATQVTNALVTFNSATSIKIPVGNTAQRPAVGVTGMQRFNTTNNALEMYYNSAWTDVGAPVFTVIADQQFNGDGVNVAFTLSSTQTTNSCIVSINGVVQIPTLAYAVAGTDPTCVLTFTEAPATGDIIDVRQITTTTSVTSIANSSGNAVIAASATAAQINVTGDLSVSGTILGGNINSTAITSGTSNMAIVSSGGNIRGNVAGTTVMTISPGLVDIVGNLTVSGNATLSGNILGDRIQNGTTSFDIQTPSGNANITVGSTSNVAVFGPTIVTLAANMVPSANITYDLGTTTQRWKDLWLSNSTIYMGNAQISANASSLIFTNPAGGQTVLAGATATSSVAGNITGGNILTGGLISATGNVYAPVIINSGVNNPQIALGNVTGIIGITTAGNTTQFGPSGQVTLGGASQIVGGTFSGSGFTAGTSQTDLFQNRGGNVTVQVGTGGTIANTWTFTNSGNLLAPGAISAVGNVTTAGVLTVNSGAAATAIVNGAGNAVGNIGSSANYFNTVFALATSAQYADLAENYAGDSAYAPGTVVDFGGDQEVTVSTVDMSSAVAGVVSTNPSYLMNAGQAGDTVVAVALTGRVPTSVTGTVHKGDLMVSAGNGAARAEANPRVGTVIGKALADSEGDAVIEVVVGRF